MEFEFIQKNPSLATQHISQRASRHHGEDHAVVVAAQKVGHLRHAQLQLLLHGQDGHPQGVPPQVADHVAQASQDGEDIAARHHHNHCHLQSLSERQLNFHHIRNGLE